MRQALRLRVVRAYQIPERNDHTKIRSKEIVFHDEEESPPFEEFRKSISHEQTPMRSIISQSSFKECSSYSVSLSGDIEVRTISEIYRDKEFGDFWVAARIVFIDDPEWYYASCRTKGCNKKLKMKGKWLWCSTCDRNWGDGTLRYRVKVRVVDLDGNAPFLLWDRECLDLLGVSADDLNSTHTKGIPKEIETLIGLNLLFRIAVRKEQFQNFLNAFPIMRIITDEKIVEKHAPELIGVRDRDLSSKLELELTDEDLWDLEENDQANEAESPLQVVAQRLNAENTLENGTEQIFFNHMMEKDNAEVIQHEIKEVEHNVMEKDNANLMTHKAKEDDHHMKGKDNADLISHKAKEDEHHMMEKDNADSIAYGYSFIYNLLM
ncbi:PREDICTED: uncharacterized protein LOC109189731 [Ipomoea nil]|uniref:uncharacterized protein LOC109189731 n=1 Tax=Ipomoea nil TaxID=35883 RepID=UPI000900D549|nr:PREDICTED: uncharacterized protein LOC109189731 [Ipomoea nil]